MGKILAIFGHCLLEGYTCNRISLMSTDLKKQEKRLKFPPGHTVGALNPANLLQGPGYRYLVSISTTAGRVPKLLTLRHCNNASMGHIVLGLFDTLT